jgi:DNA-binding CsgD family transcriptional regulator
MYLNMRISASFVVFHRLLRSGTGVHSSFVVSLKAVPGLSTTDAEHVLRFIASAEELGGDQLFTPELMIELGQLVEADWITYNELDRVRRREIFYVTRPGEDDEEPEVDPNLYWDTVAYLHPICAPPNRGDHNAEKLSDYLSLRELRNSHVYDIWFRPYGVERELSVGLPAPFWHTKVLIFDRGKGPDFTERDRAVLDHLRPHLARLWQAARTRRLLAAALAELDRVEEHDPRGMVLLGPAGEIEFASPPARRLFREYFGPAKAGLLPDALVAWLESESGRPFMQRRADRRLVVRRDGDSLVLEERTEEVPLTARERDVLSWVARGKTNAEIAELLWLAPSTVRKHLENVYAKLGVRTRTAAVARFLGRIDAEAS